MEIAKLAVAALTPLLVVALGFMVTRAARRIEDAQWANRKVIERRIELYDDMAPLLNDLFCFFTRVGHYRDVDPPDAVVRKRKLDKLFHTNQHRMGRDFGEHYMAFMDACFVTYVGPGQDARLRGWADDHRHERESGKWDAAWDALFVADHALATPVSDVKKRYDELMQSFSDFGARHADYDAKGRRQFS